MKRKILVCLLVLVLTAVSFAGCLEEDTVHNVDLSPDEFVVAYFAGEPQNVATSAEI